MAAFASPLPLLASSLPPPNENTLAMSSAVLLAAGKSTRMKSETPKVLHEVCGRPMVDHVLDAARGAGASRLVVIVGHKADIVQAALSHHSDVSFALQAEQLGTGHAVQQAEAALEDTTEPVLVLAGDTPLLRAKSLRALLEALEQHEAACVVGTAETEDNAGLGRIVRDDAGTFLRIVEEKDATDEQKAIREINTGCFAFRPADLFEALASINTDNAQGEFYLTDCVEILRDRGRTVLAECCFDVAEAIGVNTQEQLAEAEAAMNARG